MNLIKEIAEIVLGKGGKRSLKTHMVWGAVGTLALKILNTVLVFGTSTLLARLLGAKEYGVYAYAVSWATLLSIPAVMGLNTLLVREVAEYRALEDWGSLRGIFRWSDRVVLFTSIAIATVFSLTVCLLRGRFPPEVRSALWIAMTLVPLLSFLLLRQGGLRGLGYVVEAQVPQFIILPLALLPLVMGVHLITTGLSGVAAVGLRALAGLVALLAALMFLKRRSPRHVATVPPSYHRREWLRSAMPLLFVGAAGIINQRMSTVMVGAMLGPQAVGVFDVSVKVAALVGFTLMAVNMPLAPAVAELYAKGERERLQRLITKSARVALLGSIPIFLGMTIFGREVLSIFGRDFASGRIVLAILSAGQLVNVAMGSVALLLNMTGHEVNTAKGVGIAAVANVMLNAVLIPLWGVNGAAVASATSMITWNALLAWWVYKKLSIYPTALGKPRRRTA